MTSDQPLQPGIDTHGSGSHTKDMHGAQEPSQIHDTPTPIPFRIQPSAGKPEDYQRGDPFSDAGPYEALDAAEVEQEAGVTSSIDVADEDADSAAPVDAGQAEEGTMNDFAAPVVTDEELHEQRGASTAASVPSAMETEPENKETAVLETIDEDMATTPKAHPQQQSPTQSFSTPNAQPASSKGKQAAAAPAEPASDSDYAESGLDASNGVVTIPIPAHYHQVRNFLWLQKSIAEAQPAPGGQPAPRTPSPKKPPKRTPASSAVRRGRASKKTSSKTISSADDDNWSPRLTRSAKKGREEVLEESDTQEAPAAPRATPIKKITLHFTRKSKVETEDDAAPEPEEEEQDEDE